MGASFHIEKDLLPLMRTKVRKLSGKTIEIGSFGKHAYLAGIHEFGCHIPVTPKMRAWLHHNGIHLKEATTEIVIPERSFLRAGFDSEEEEIANQINIQLAGYLTKNARYDFFLKDVGKDVATKIQNFAKKLEEPPKSEATKLLEGGTKNSPLDQTGEMIKTISFRIVKEETGGEG